MGTNKRFFLDITAISDRLNELHMTESDLADMMFLTPAALKVILKRGYCKRLTAVKIALALNTDVDSIRKEDAQ